MRTTIAALAFALSLGYAGSASAEGFSCTMGSGEGRTCIDTTWTGANYQKAGGMHACSKKGGTPGNTCTRTGSIGGCKFAMSGQGQTITTTQWHYTGSPSAVMASCDSQGGRFVKP
jgi:hypothetical protein